jgi:hypothetical protein
MMAGIETYATAGLDSAVNEDGVWLSGDSTVGVALVLDGVTSPDPKATGCEHGVTWFVENLGHAILTQVEQRVPEEVSTKALQVAVRSAVTSTAHKHLGRCDLSRLATPQATMALAAWDRESVCVAILCDSYAVVKDADGACRVLTDPALQLIQDFAPDYGVRRYRNVPDGFHTLAADPSVSDFIRTWSIPRNDIQGLVLTTDGAARYVREYRLGSWEDLYEEVRSNAEDFVRSIRSFESGRPIRTDAKRSDDVALARIDLSPPEVMP